MGFGTIACCSEGATQPFLRGCRSVSRARHRIEDGNRVCRPAARDVVVGEGKSGGGPGGVLRKPLQEWFRLLRSSVGEHERCHGAVRAAMGGVDLDRLAQRALRFQNLVRRPVEVREREEAADISRCELYGFEKRRLRIGLPAAGVLDQRELRIAGAAAPVEEYRL